MHPSGYSTCADLGLDPVALGEACAGLLLASRQLGHVRPRFTAETYVHPASKEGQFLVDLFKATTAEMAARYQHSPPPPQSKRREPGFGRMHRIK